MNSEASGGTYNGRGRGGEASKKCCQNEAQGSWKALRGEGATASGRNETPGRPRHRTHRPRELALEELTLRMYDDVMAIVMRNIIYGEGQNSSRKHSSGGRDP